MFIRRFSAANLLLISITSASSIDFGKDIQPIFARHCYECHGSEKQKGKLRLDDRKIVLEGQGDNPAVVIPRNAKQSELYRRITLPKGHEDIMPNRGAPLSKAEIDLIHEWINQGAIWPENAGSAKHWAYVAPKRPDLPQMKSGLWAKNPIDAFIFARLKKENLKPSPEADRARLLRRVYLDLIGLPPSPSEAKAFLVDQSPDAYEKVVDRLLQSPHYGERWARPWLDVARYADSIGFQRDELWELWPYRDWVIKALNDDMPFDQFTIEQIAGDLLPDATVEQKIATGFNRCTATNIESGSDQEETRSNQIFDRVNTVGTVWLGSTIECAQCHNHKYDPFSQKDYYQLFAFFNNTPQETTFKSAKAKAALDFIGPYVSLADDTVEKKKAALQKELDELDYKIETTSKTFAARQEAWELETTAKAATSAQAHILDIADFQSESDSFHEILDDKSVLLRANDNAAAPDKDSYTVTVRTELAGITAFKLEVLTDPSLPGRGPGRGDDKRPNFVLTEFSVSMVTGEQNKPSPIGLREARASFAQKNFPAANAIDAAPRTGWAINPQFFKDHWVIFETASPLGSPEGATLTFKLEQDFGGARTIGRFRLSALTGQANSDGIPADVARIVATPRQERTPAQQMRLSNFYLAQQPEVAGLKAARSKVEAAMKDVQAPRTLVMKELDQPRSSTLFVRGNFLEKGEPVQPDVPAVLNPLPPGPRSRLTLARWLVSPENPLTARVTVNRWWAEFFGMGLVGTPEDFGIKGEPPTHPELLDWLACEFMEPTVTNHESRVRPWSIKHLHRLIVTSATYRQSANTTSHEAQADDQNKWLARGPRLRMDAEMIRDNALAAAGLLSLKIGGPPVRPYQPPGIWENKVGGTRVTYNLSEGEDRFRRGVYTVWKRTSPYPSFINFDAPNRNACVVRRLRSNTPLQALTLLNDPVYVEAAKALARRVLTEKASASLEDKLRFAFQLCLTRTPTGSELKTLLRLYHEQLASSRQHAGSAEKLLGDFQKPPGVDAAHFAAWYSVASALLNLDETITKG